MKINNIKVSLLAANYNNADYLEDFLDSIVNSSELPDESIIVDDCSKDDSISILESYKSKIPNLKIIFLDKNVGFANALNVGLEHVTCDYVLRVDPDDILHFDRIFLQKEAISIDNTIDVVGSNIVYFVDNINTEIGRSNFPSLHEDIKKRYVNGYHGLVHGSSMIRASILKQLRYDQTQVPAEEYDLFSRILIYGYSTKNLKNCLTYVRIHSVSATYNYPIDTFKKIVVKQREYWNCGPTKLNFYRKYFMIKFYRMSLSKKLFERVLFKFLAGALAPHLLLRRIIKD